MPRALWKGAISFGSIYVNKKTGKEVDWLTSSRAMARGELEKIGRRGRTKSAAEIGQGAKARLKVNTGDFA